MKIENFFLRYAYPCAYIIADRGELSQIELKKKELFVIKYPEYKPVKNFVKNHGNCPIPM